MRITEIETAEIKHLRTKHTHVKDSHLLRVWLSPVVVQLLSRVLLFATPWTAACQISLSLIISWSLVKLKSIESVMLSNHLILCHPFLLLPSIFPSIRNFSILQSQHQHLFPLGLTGLISWQSKGLARVFSSITIWKLQFFSAQPSLWSNSHICTWLLEKPQLWLYGPLLAKWCLCFLICC